MLLASSILHSYVQPSRGVRAMLYTAIVSLSLSPVASSTLFAQEAAQDPQQQQQQQSSTPVPSFSFNAQTDAPAPPSESRSERPWSFWRTTRQIVFDPTTYAPAVISYEATKLDWDTSQVFFRNGYVEGNPRYTLSGLPNDTPMPYGRGDRKIMMDTIQILGGSMANNFIERSMEQVLMERYPDHPKLVKTLGWIERSVFASYWSYRLSATHFRQWQTNKQQAASLGLQ
jgi:hypothetical protein